MTNTVRKETIEIYQNSVMTKPKYFKFSSAESELKKLYKKNNKSQFPVK